jgi:hypothetical protein
MLTHFFRHCYSLIVVHLIQISPCNLSTIFISRLFICVFCILATAEHSLGFPCLLSLLSWYLTRVDIHCLLFVMFIGLCFVANVQLSWVCRYIHVLLISETSTVHFVVTQKHDVRYAELPWGFVVFCIIIMYLLHNSRNFSIIPQSVLRQVHNLFQTGFVTPCDVIIPLFQVSACSRFLNVIQWLRTSYSLSFRP